MEQLKKGDKVNHVNFKLLRLTKRKIIIIFLFVTSIIAISMCFYWYWKGFVDDSSGYNSIDTAIALAGGIMNLMTLIFLYLNYIELKNQIQLTKDEIVINKEQDEFNRAIDIVYKQLEYSKRNLSSEPFVEIYEKIMLELIFENYDSNKKILADENIDSRLNLNNLFEMLEKEIKPYQIIVMDNYMLTKEQKIFLGNLIGINFAEHFDTTIERFINLSRKVTNEPEFIINNNAEGRQHRLNNLRIAEEIFQLINGNVGKR